MPMTSTKKRTLLSKVGVRSSRCPRWAMSMMGSGCIFILLSFVSGRCCRPVVAAGEDQDEIIGRHRHDVGEREAICLGKGGQVTRVAHAPRGVARAQARIELGIARRRMRTV